MKASLNPATVIIPAILRLVTWTALALACCLCPRASAAGTWTALSNRAPGSVNTMLLLPDGTVFAADANNWTNCYRLTPDIHGSYLNGTWTTLAAMHDSRLYYASDVLTNGRVFVAGAEYGSGGSSGEIYDPLLNTWTMITGGAGQSFVDMISVVLPDSTILMAPVGPSKGGQTAVYDPETDTWPLFPKLVRGYDEDEASWVMLPDNSILTVDSFSTNSERYIPSLDKWINDATLPVSLYDTNLGEIGPFFLLADSNVFSIGNAGFTALYTPSGTTTPGSWMAGPAEPAGLGAPDAPGAMMTDGNVLFILGPSTNYSAPSSFFEYDPIANDIVPVEGPGSFTNDTLPYVNRMLDLPDGNVLLSVSGRQLYEYQPSGAPLAAGQPAITSISTNFYRSYHLTGRLLNGISQGAAYGDDAQMNSNYPLIRMTNAQGNVYYARTYNWSSTTVMTGSLPVTTEFMVPQNLPAGTYSLVVVANGNSSAPFSFTFAPDALAISALTGFGAIGPSGGPVAAESATYTLTNTGSSSINWALGNVPGWLNASSTNGSLAASGGTSIVTLSVNTTNAALLAVGSYAATVWFTNLATGAIQGVPFSYLSTPLVVNGGFEYGSTTFWKFSGDLGSSGIGNTGDSSGQQEYIHSGFYGALLGQNGGLGYLSQTIPTVAGQQYSLSFWLDSFSDNQTNEFMVTWNGTNIFSETNVGNFPFVNIQLPVVGTALDSVLEFAFFQDTNSTSFSEQTNFFGLDDVTLTLEYPPTISASPSNQIVLQGSTPTLTVQALGSPTLDYQWRFDGTNLAQATNSSLVLANVKTNQSGTYTVVVTNLYGAITSSPALLTVLLPGPPVITVPPVSQTVNAGATAPFTVQATGPGPFSYQWEINGANLAGATNSNLTLTNVSTNQGGFYTVTVSNTNGPTLSRPALLTVFPPSILQNGGFETGDFSFWTVSGNTNDTAVVGNSPYTHSGVYGVESGPVGSPVFISQTLATVPGQTYLVSCWVNNPEGATPNDFSVTWNGSSLINQTNISSAIWTNLQATVMAAGASATLSFGIQDNPAYLGLDDINVDPLPQPSFVAINSHAGAIVFEWSTLAGLNYQLQYTSDLQSAWTDFGGVTFASNTISITTDSLTNAQRFYRLLLLP